jgi:DNA-binding response OmpR family regulator
MEAMSPTPNGKTILLAEDEQEIRSFVLAMLRHNGYHVIVAGDGHDALQKARAFDGTIHLLLSDVQMPNMTGIELATQLQIDRPAIRILLMSGLPAGLLLLNDGWQFLPKPFMTNLLKDRINHLLLEQPTEVGASATTSGVGGGTPTRR